MVLSTSSNRFYRGVRRRVWSALLPHGCMHIQARIGDGAFTVNEYGTERVMFLTRFVLTFTSIWYHLWNRDLRERFKDNGRESPLYLYFLLHILHCLLFLKRKNMERIPIDHTIVFYADTLVILTFLAWCFWDFAMFYYVWCKLNTFACLLVWQRKEKIYLLIYFFIILFYECISGS